MTNLHTVQQPVRMTELGGMTDDSPSYCPAASENDRVALWEVTFQLPSGRLASTHHGIWIIVINKCIITNYK